ncbi:MAG: toll/interleukin-1 receptor domain-containing protein [Clostridiaceae bacterium]|nr:toll/interleukin-1 receptor domain-containing protein [Clostridiaceae bacterium]
MPTIFLSHTSIDKPFVEKLARDLMRLGINVWYDKYEIKVGESILWKIDEGIRESEYLGIVISREAWESEWVKTEISSAWQKQVKQKGNFILPIYHRECEMPLFLSGIKYADFRTDYQSGLQDLARVFGVKELDVITEDNWRKFSRVKGGEWKNFRVKEFENLITRICKIARTYNFTVWTGREKNPFSFTISGRVSGKKSMALTIRMDPAKSYQYMAADTVEANPNRIDKKCYKTLVGMTVNEVEEYVCRRIQHFVEVNGKPEQPGSLFTDRHMDFNEIIEGVMEIVKKTNWDQKAVNVPGLIK